jgi:bifunctional non-homologous end joining protein LigD
LSYVDSPVLVSSFSSACRSVVRSTVSYYSLIAPVLLPHLTGRPVTTIRFPDGVGGQQFFEKNVPRGAPDWLRTVRLPSAGSRGSGDTIEYPLFEELPALVWAANLAALELHVPQWTIGPGPARRPPDLLVFDLDPGDGTTIVECARVAERLYDSLVADGLTPLAKTSGSKRHAGLRRRQHPPTRPHLHLCQTLAEQLAHETPTYGSGKCSSTGHRTTRPKPPSSRCDRQSRVVDGSV